MSSTTEIPTWLYLLACAYIGLTFGHLLAKWQIKRLKRKQRENMNRTANGHVFHLYDPPAPVPPTDCAITWGMFTIRQKDADSPVTSSDAPAQGFPLKTMLGRPLQDVLFELVGIWQLPPIVSAYNLRIGQFCREGYVVQGGDDIKLYLERT